MTGLLDLMTKEEMSTYTREGWVNVNDSPEVRVWLSNLPYENLLEIEQLRQQAEVNGQMEHCNKWLGKLVVGKE